MANFVKKGSTRSEYNVHYTSWADRVEGIKCDLGELANRGIISEERAFHIMEEEDIGEALDLIEKYGQTK